MTLPENVVVGQAGHVDDHREIAELLNAASATYAPATVFAKDYCVQDGVTDDGPGLQDAFDALVAQGGGTLRLTPGATYYVNTPIVAIAPGVNVNLDATGAQILAGPTVVDLISIAGTRTQVGGDNAYAETTRGSSTVVLNADYSASLAPGDWVMLWSEDVDNPERPTQYMSGEAARVVSVTTSPLRLFLDRPVQLVHTAGVKRRLYRLDLTSKPTVRGLDALLDDTGVGQTPLTFRYADTPRTEGTIRVRGKSGKYGILVDQSISPEISGVEAEDIYDAANGTSPTGMAVRLSGCVGGYARVRRATRCRHAIDIQSFSTATSPGLVSVDNTIGGEAVACWSPPFSTHHARRTIFDNPVSLGSGGCVLARGYDSTILNPVLIGGLVPGAAASKPPEWDFTRTSPAVVTLGETDTLPAGQGFSAEKVRIDNPVGLFLPSEYSLVLYSDDPVDVVVTGPGTLAVPTPALQHRVRSTTQSVTNANVSSANMLNDDVLSVTVPPGVYAFQAVIFYDAGTTGDLLISGWRSGTGEGSNGLSGLAASVSAAATTASAQSGASYGSLSPFAVGGGNGGTARYLMATLVGTVTVTARESLGVRYAQQVSDAVPATIGIGSRLRVERIA